MGNEEVEAVNVFVRLGSVVARNHPQISVPYIASFLCSMSWVECSAQSLRSSEWWSLHHLEVLTFRRQNPLHNCLSHWSVTWKVTCQLLSALVQNEILDPVKGAGIWGEHRYPWYWQCGLYKICYKGKEGDKVVAWVAGNECILFFWLPENWVCLQDRCR